MNGQEDSLIDIYLGSRIEHDSERAALAHVIRLLRAGKLPAVVLANINIRGRQIDLIVALETVTLLIEAKGYTRPVNGGANGPWQLMLASGRSSDVGNAYVQALTATNALRDAMRAFVGSDIGYYPRAVVVFVPDIPPGSSLSAGDHKVSLIGLSSLTKEMRATQPGCWSTAQWRAFAHHCNLDSVTTIEAACDPTLLRAEQRVNEYLRDFRRTYAAAAEAVVEFMCVADREEVTSSEIARRAVERRDALFIGPSGCGKSLLASSCGVMLTEVRGVPITVQAKDYKGSLKTIMDWEVGLMADCSAVEMLAATRRLNLPTLLIVDGYNECDEHRRIALTRSIAAISKRFGMGVLITSQVEPARRDLLPYLPEVIVPATERNVKVTIASRALKGACWSPTMEALIDSVESGLEASLVGEVGLQASFGVSRYGLFDAYARKRLRADASDGIRALSLIAGWLTDHVALSLTVRDLDRLSQTHQIPATLLADLIDSGLLSSRGDRVSLGHEQFFCAFSAESVIRRSAGLPDKILTALGSPRHSDQKEFIVGAIDDDFLLLQVLSQVADPSIVAGCLSGRCGRGAKDWSERHMSSVLTRMLDEAEGARFLVTGDTWWEAAFDPEHLAEWSAQDGAFIQCLPQLLVEGHYLPQVFGVVEALDRKIDEEIYRLRQEAQPAKNLKDSIFAISYGLGASRAAAISRVCVTTHSSLGRNPRLLILDELARMGSETLSWGRIYLVTSLYRNFGGGIWTSSHASDAAFFYTSVITKRWKTLPYHLRLAVVDGAGYCSDAKEPGLSDLVKAVESLLTEHNPIFNSMIFDVLQRLRPFSPEEESHADTVRSQIVRLLEGVGDNDDCEEAYSIYNCQFDHPYSNAYCEVLNSLADKERHRFLKMALGGANEGGFFLSLLISEATALNDSSITPLLTRWTALPRRDSTQPQEAIEVFVRAHIALGRLCGELPIAESTGEDAASKCLLACGLVLYWCNRHDISEADRRRACRAALGVLEEHEAISAVTAIKDCADFRMRWSSSNHGETSIVTYFPVEVAELCRNTLERPKSQAGYFPDHSDRHSFGVLSFSIRVLALYGGFTDLALLRRFVDHAELGKDAISAIHKISERH